MSEEELRQYCKDASNEIIKLGEENTQLKKEKDDFIKTIIELQYEIIELKSVLKEIREIINGYMPNEHAMCKAFDEIEFIINKGIGEDK